MKEPRVVFGFHAVLARLRAEPKSVLEIFLDEARNDARGKDLAVLAERAGVRLMRVPTKRLDGFYGGGRPPGGVGRAEGKGLLPRPGRNLQQVGKTPGCGPGGAPPPPQPRRSRVRA